MAAEEDARKKDERLGELMLYIAQQSEDDPDFGATKLNKILFNIDFIAYARRAEPVTGQEYQHLPQGPCVRRLAPVQQMLEEKGRAAVQETLRGPYVQKRLLALRDPDLSGFSGDEIALVDYVIRALRGANAREVSDWSHEFIGWKVTRDYETIPYETVYLNDRTPPTEADLQYGRQLAKTHACTG